MGIEIKPEPWMWATDLSSGWFYRKHAVNRMSVPVRVGNVVDAISKNGVVMLNAALRGDGTLRFSCRQRFPNSRSSAFASPPRLQQHAVPPVRSRNFSTT
jgi:hypothetical protein